MASITTRVGKGSPLTTQELDANFTNLNTAKLEKSGETATFADLTLESVAATLHRSPNAITSLFVYDTSKDSDGGAWTEKCQHTSWYQETINGKWLGAQASEAAARAVTGATTNDYYQLTTDGKFYKLNATSGVTEVYRGNKRSFPKLAAIVAEAASVTIYDLTEAASPAWARYPNSGAMATGNIAALSAVNGQIFAGGASGLAVLDFDTDRLTLRNATNLSSQAGLATIRTSARSTEAGTALTNAAVAALAVTITPDAPTHPATGLKVPTVALATGARVVVIRNDGALVNSSSTSAFTQITLTPQLLSAGRADAVWYYAANPNALSAAFALTTKNASTATDFNVGNTTLLKAKDRANYARTSGAVVQLLRNNEGTIGKGITAKLSDTYNTGWLAGDIRRAYLSDVSAGSVTATELVTNGTFDTDTTGWSASATMGISWVNGTIQLTSNAGSYYAYTYQTLTGLTPGAGYAVMGTVVSATTASHTNQLRIMASTSDGSQIGSASFTVSANPQYLRATFVATGTTAIIRLYTGGQNATIVWDNVSCRLAVPDRSYKAAASNIYGTLTSTAVNTGNSLVGYSGFSGSNYIREPYSADLDFGTGEWSCSAWVNTPTGFLNHNLIANPGEFSGFQTAAVTVTTDVDPDPAVRRIIPTTSTTKHSYYFDLGGSVGGAIISVYAKSAGYERIALNEAAQTGDSSAIANLTTGANAVPVGGGWYRLSFYVSAAGTPKRFHIVVLPNGGSGENPNSYTWAGDGTSGVDIKNPIISWGSVLFDYVSGQTSAYYSRATILARSHSSGASISLGQLWNGPLTATAFDGTTTRTVTTTAAYNTATWLKARANYTTDGTLAILVNGVEVAAATGTPLLTLNNANAVLTIGNSYALDAPFPGSIALLKLSASVPTSEQALFMYEQEKHLFTAGAKCVLPASTSVLDLAYDDATDTWSTLQATFESSFSGLVRTATQTPSAGSFSKVAEGSGVQLLGRITTNPGVDVRMPAKNLRSKDMPRDINQDIMVFDFDAVTSQTDFLLPVGYTARVVYSAGSQKRIGSTKDYTVLFDGFRETVRFGTAPGNGVWVQIHAVKEVSL